MIRHFDTYAISSNIYFSTVETAKDKADLFVTSFMTASLTPLDRIAWSLLRQYPPGFLIAQDLQQTFIFPDAELVFHPSPVHYTDTIVLMKKIFFCHFMI